MWDYGARKQLEMKFLLFIVATNYNDTNKFEINIHWTLYLVRLLENAQNVGLCIP